MVYILPGGTKGGLDARRVTVRCRANSDGLVSMSGAASIGADVAGSEASSMRTSADWLAGGGEMGARMRAHDWSGTALGPAESWPQSLKTAVRIMLTSRYAMFVWWGRDLINLYNDAYAPMLGARHPAALGSSAKEIWSEIWHLIGPRTDAVLLHGEATFDERLLLMLERYGYREETYFTFSYSPVPGDDGGIGGLFCAVTEDTDAVIGERRLRTIRDVAAAVTGKRTPDALFRALDLRLAAADRDLPFASVYLIDEASKEAALVGTSFPDGHAAAPKTTNLAAKDSPWPIAQALSRREAILIEELSKRFSELPNGAWDRPPSQAVVLPFAQPGTEKPTGVVIFGLNPYLRFDERYRSFVELLVGQVAAGLADVRAYEQERKRAEALAELDRAKTAFFSNVSHEFRTPLTLMLGPLEQLKGEFGPSGDGLSASHREQIDLVHRNGLRLLKLVNTLLDFSRIEAGRMQASYDSTDLPAYTAELASVFRAAIERAGLKLIVECPPAPAPAYVDREMWEKIVLNLLSNALKFTFAGEIEVKLRATPALFELTVRDTGIGVPREELFRIFERFHRVAAARGRTHEGSGIGLALVQELARLHGGTVTVESVIDRGSTFRVVVPAGSGHLAASQIGAARTRASTALGATLFVEEALRWLPQEPEAGRGAPVESPPEIPAAGGERPRVLLADDNADMRDYVRRILSPSYAVEAVGDGEAALASIARQKPDLVLSDVMMPRLDGIGLLARLRADPGTGTLPVILLSARAGEEAKVEGLASGADDYLIKPFSARELLAHVAANIAAAKFRREATAALRESEQRLRMALSAGKFGSWDLTLADLDLISSDQCKANFGRAPNEPFTYEMFRASIHPEDLARVMAAVGHAIETIGDYEADYRCIWPDGSVHWINARGRASAGESGSAVRMTGVTLDITERKQAEQACAYLGAIVESSDDAIISKTLEGVITSWNDGAERLFGYSAEEAIGQPITMLIPPERLEEEPKIIERLRRGERVDHFETKRRRKDGTLLDISLTISPVKDEQGRVVGASKVARDISERKQAEQALRESEERLRLALAAGAVSTWHWDIGRDRLQSDSRLAFLFDCDPHALAAGLPRSEVIRAIHAEDRPRVDAAMRHAIEAASVYEAEYRVRAADGQIRWVAARGEPQSDADGRTRRIFGTLTDITERKQAERTQQLLVNELNHRVKNTLASVQAIVQHTLRRTKDPAEFVRSIGGRIQSLSRVHSFLSRTTWQSADLGELIRDQLMLDSQEETRITVWGPAVRLEAQTAMHMAMMLHELGTNASKYGALSRAHGRVTVSWTVEDASLRLRWLERGGPPASAPASRGFGMTLIEQSARGQGGEAHLSVEAEGIAWDIAVPLAPSDAASVPSRQRPAEPVPQPQARAVRGIEDAARPLAGKRFLVVEDEALVALDVVTVLEEAGAEAVRRAGTVKEALRIVESESLHAALLDGNLHSQPVDEVAAALTRRNVPFLFVSGYGRESMPRGFAATGLLGKPFSQTQLVAAAAQLVEQRAR